MYNCSNSRQFSSPIKHFNLLHFLIFNLFKALVFSNAFKFSKRFNPISCISSREIQSDKQKILIKVKRNPKNFNLEQLLRLSSSNWEQYCISNFCNEGQFSNLETDTKSVQSCNLINSIELLT